MEIFQEILTYIIIAAAIFLAGYRITKVLTAKKTGCSGCSDASCHSVQKK